MRHTQTRCLKKREPDAFTKKTQKKQLVPKIKHSEREEHVWYTCLLEKPQEKTGPDALTSHSLLKVECGGKKSALVLGSLTLIGTVCTQWKGVSAAGIQ